MKHQITLGALALLAGCVAQVDPARDDVGAAASPLVSAGVFGYHPTESATKAFVSPLAGVGYTVAVELERIWDVPFSNTPIRLRRIVVFAVGHDLELTGEIFDTGYDKASPANELIAAVPTESANRTAVLTRELFELPGDFGFDFEPFVIHRARLFHPYEGTETSDTLLSNGWPGRPEGAEFPEYTIHQACGRLAGNDVLLLAERIEDDAPDSYRSALYGLRMQAGSFDILDQVELARVDWRGLPATPIWSDVQCTDAHYLETGWRVVRRDGAGLRQHDLPSSFSGRIGVSPGAIVATPAPGETFGEFRIAGTVAPGDETRDRFQLLVERQDSTGTRLTSFTQREPFLRRVTREWRELGPTAPGGLALAYDRHSMSEWYLIDRSTPTATALPADETRLRRLGYDGFAYSHRRVSSAFVGNPDVTHAHEVDDALFIYTNDVSHTVQAGSYAPRPASYDLIGSTSHGTIGPRFDDGGSYLGTQPSTATSGNDAFTITADGTWPNWKLELVIADGIDFVDGEWIPDEVRANSIRIGARSDGSGHAEAPLFLGSEGLTNSMRSFFPTGPHWPRFAEGGLVSSPSHLYAQWTWTELQIDPDTWKVTEHPRRSDVLSFRPAP